jgi:hypothetical protein
VTEPVLHLIKLCVGAEAVENLIEWQTARLAASGAANPVHVTRMRPKRAAELLAGGSLYWVFKGQVLARQTIVRLDEVTREDGASACAIVLSREITRTYAVPRRPFQGWRYLPAGDAPRDLPEGAEGAEDMPPELLSALSDFGIG